MNPHPSRSPAESSLAGQALQKDIAAFFDAFAHAFLSFNGKAIAERYAAPYLALNADGALTLLQTPAEIAGYFQRVLDSYLAQGCRSCQYRALEVCAVGSQSAMATVTWELLDQGGDVLSSWRESYTLLRAAEGLQIFGSIDHAE